MLKRLAITKAEIMFLFRFTLVVNVYHYICHQNMKNHQKPIICNILQSNNNCITVCDYKGQIIHSTRADLE